MSKLRIALLATLLLGVILTVVAFAGGFSVVKYDDTRLKDFKPGPVTSAYITNGAFTEWADGKPVAWNAPTPALSPGWEVHFAQMDYGWGGEDRGINNAVGYFFRTGTSDSQYAGISQQVSPMLASGTYWVQVHITAWESNVKSPYNSVAWYGFGTSADTSSVTEWRELFPDEFVCANEDGTCNHLGRAEAVHIDAGSYLHVYMGMKFPDHGAWTVFGLDDISITDFAEGVNEGIDDFIDDGDVTWDPEVQR